MPLQKMNNSLLNLPQVDPPLLRNIHVTTDLVPGHALCQK